MQHFKALRCQKQCHPIQLIRANLSYYTQIEVIMYLIQSKLLGYFSYSTETKLAVHICLIKSISFVSFQKLHKLIKQHQVIGHSDLKDSKPIHYRQECSLGFVDEAITRYFTINLFDLLYHLCFGFRDFVINLLLEKYFEKYFEDLDLQKLNQMDLLVTLLLFTVDMKFIMIK